MNDLERVKAELIEGLAEHGTLVQGLPVLVRRRYELETASAYRSATEDLTLHNERLAIIEKAFKLSEPIGKKHAKRTQERFTQADVPHSLPGTVAAVCLAIGENTRLSHVVRELIHDNVLKKCTLRDVRETIKQEMER